MDTQLSSANTLPQDLIYNFAASAWWGRRPGAACFAARMSGLYRSDDEGATWRLLYESLQLNEPLSTMAVAISPDFEQQPHLFAGLGGGILRSLDGGQHWENVHFPPPPAVVTCLVTSPNYTQDGLLFAGTLEDGLFFSTDCGLHWQAGSFGLLDLKLFCLAVSPNFAHDQTLFAGTHSGLFRSANGGRSWREVSLPPGYDAVFSLALSPHFAQDGVLFAGTETQGLLRSDDGGRSWARLGENILTDAINTVLLSPQFPRQPDILALHGGTLLLSHDAGLSWQPWREAALAEKRVTTVLAPLGFDPGAPSLVGLLDGDILNIR